jgi:hypothetical protein
MMRPKRHFLDSEKQDVLSWVEQFNVAVQARNWPAFFHAADNPPKYWHVSVRLNCSQCLRAGPPGLQGLDVYSLVWIFKRISAKGVATIPNWMPLAVASGVCPLTRLEYEAIARLKP